MSLNVDTFIYEANGKWTLLEDPDDDYNKTRAGFESARQKLWGSEAVRVLGAHFFPRLDGDNLQVEPREIDAFLAECGAIRPYLDHLGEVSGYGAEYVTECFDNIVAASVRAKAEGGGVIVW
ncbi:hypothetical protein ACIOEZ_16960 [Streptomyces sp. NPDC087866]|uniref:hypothetical protein n=1 Tax=unclassified Streptomyces TaxID=2593676 RepID=UPI0022513A5E|nr:hypothetical protein [Streptomyces sp. NBC_01789]MCX4451327.1 hypothetical protein [Streptomyces sp. NBC_01789]